MYSNYNYKLVLNSYSTMSWLRVHLKGSLIGLLTLMYNSKEQFAPPEPRFRKKTKGSNIHYASRFYFSVSTHWKFCFFALVLLVLLLLLLFWEGCSFARCMFRIWPLSHGEWKTLSSSVSLNRLRLRLMYWETAMGVVLLITNLFR